MDRLQYRDMLRQERQRLQRAIKAGQSGTTIASWNNRSKMDQSFSHPVYDDFYSLSSPPTVVRFFPLGYGAFGTTLGFMD